VLAEDTLWNSSSARSGPGGRKFKALQQSLGAGLTAELALKRAASAASFGRRSAVLATFRRGLLIRGSLVRSQLGEPFLRGYAGWIVHCVHRIPHFPAPSAANALQSRKLLSGVVPQ